MRDSARYVKLGAFVAAGIALAAAGAALLGGGSFFGDGLPFETTLDESVQGLNVGTQVKLLGVTVGRVLEVGFAPPGSPGGHRVRIRGRLDLDDLPPEWRARPAESLRREVRDGLRARLTSVGLSGQLYLELDDFPDAPLAEDEGDGATVRIPSVPSLQAELFGSAEDVLSGLAKADLAGLAERTARLLEELAGAAAELRRLSAGQGAELGRSMENLSALTEDLRRLAARAERDPGGVLFGSPPPPVEPGRSR